MSVKQETRKKAVDGLLDFIKSECNESEHKVAEPGILSRYSYRSGISMRTLTEYFTLLREADLIVKEFIEEKNAWRWTIPRRPS